MQTPKAIIFDCDGTLVDSEVVCQQGLILKFAPLGVRLERNDFDDRYRGWKLAAIVEDVCSRFGVKVDETFERDYRALVDDLARTNGLQPMPGVTEMLRQISIQTCVASSAPVHKIETFLHLAGIRQFFDDRIFSSYEIQKWKPDPGLFLHCADCLGVRPEQCVVVEDSDVGVRAAMAAGMRAFWYRPGGSKSVRNEQVKSFTDMKSLPGLLGL